MCAQGSGMGLLGSSLAMADCGDVSLGLFFHLWYTILPTMTTSTYTTYRAMNPEGRENVWCLVRQVYTQTARGTLRQNVYLAGGGGITP